MCLFFFLSISVAYSKVEPKNYNFSLKTLQKFNPGSSIHEVKDPKITKPKPIYSTNSIVVYKFFVEHIRYRFEAFVQTNAKGIILDYYARLPQYFLHDVFHQTLINEYGMQDKYKKVEEAALYSWNNLKGVKIVYYGSCTINCFPVYISVSAKNIKQADYKSLLQQFNDDTKLYKEDS